MFKTYAAPSRAFMLAWNASSLSISPLIAVLRQACFLSVPGSWSFSRSWPHVDVRVGCLQRTHRRCLAGLQPIERGHRDYRPGGTSQAWRQACNLGVRSCVCHAGSSFPHSKTVPSTQMQWRITASFRATATCAFFIPLRLARRRPHVFSAHHRFVRCSRTLAASKR